MHGTDEGGPHLLGRGGAAIGVRIHRSAYSLVAEAASGRVAELLRVQPGWPVLVGTETTYDHSGEPVNLGHAVYRGDAYRFQADLFRPQD